MWNITAFGDPVVPTLTNLAVTVVKASSTRKLPIYLPYSVSTPIIATMISGGTP